MSDLISESEVLEVTGTGNVLEVRFGGVHEWTHGSQMSRVITDAICAHSPVRAIVISLLRYEYEAGDDISGFFEAFIDRERHALRPACIVATGKTYASMEPFFAAARLLEMFRLRFVASVEEALTWLHDEVSPEGA